MANERYSAEIAELIRQEHSRQDDLRQRFESAFPAEEYKDEIDLDKNYREVTEFRMDRTDFLIRHIPTDLLDQWSVMNGPRRLKTSIQNWVDGINVTFPQINQE